MRFRTFMKRNYLNDEGCKGSLARSIKADGRNFPIRTSHDTYRRFLELYCKASDGVLDAFEECFKEWKELEKSKKKQ